MQIREKLREASIAEHAIGCQFVLRRSTTLQRDFTIARFANCESAVGGERFSLPRRERGDQSRLAGDRYAISVPRSSRNETSITQSTTLFWTLRSPEESGFRIQLRNWKFIAARRRKRAGEIRTRDRPEIQRDPARSRCANERRVWKLFAVLLDFCSRLQQQSATNFVALVRGVTSELQTRFIHNVYFIRNAVFHQLAGIFQQRAGCCFDTTRALCRNVRKQLCADPTIRVRLAKSSEKRSLNVSFPSERVHR